MEWHYLCTACAVVNPHHQSVLWPPFPSWREEYSFSLHEGLSVSGNLSLIPPLPAPLAVRPAEYADVQIQPGTQSGPESIFKAVCSKVMAVGLTGIWASFSAISWQAGQHLVHAHRGQLPRALYPSARTSHILHVMLEQETFSRHQLPGGLLPLQQGVDSNAFAGLMPVPQQSGKFA